jgi:Holliday junction resolvasome RuvABC ATP-dependent DNA helicase subunit
MVLSPQMCDAYFKPYFKHRRFGMEKLNLLRPDLRKTILKNARREKIEYLNIPYNMTLERLKHDIDNGARQYSGIYDMLQNKVSRVVLVKSHSREEGLAAISYMVGILNRKDDREDIEKSDEPVEFVNNIYGDKKESKPISENLYEDENDYDEYEPFGNDVDYEDDIDIRDIDYDNCWNGTDYMLPVIGVNEFRDYTSSKNRQMGFGNGPFMFGAEHEEAAPPFWVDSHAPNICVEAAGYFEFYTTDVESLDELMNYRRIFLLECDSEPVAFESDKAFSNFNDGLSGNDYTRMSEFENELLIEYSSDTVNVRLSSEQYADYYRILVENWLYVHSLNVEKNFPMDEFVRQISRMNRQDKSYLIDRLLTVLQDKKELNGVLKKDDLMTFDMFRYILQDNQKTEHSASYRLEHELVGMDSVKEQIHHIIDMMKMNRLRESRGLSANNFHNVFLLLGAPGTAKTTVANLMGKLMREERLLPGDRFASVNGTELKGMYVGHSAPKTKQLFDQYDIILIDEAYSLAAADCGGMDIFAQEALSQLMIELEKHSKDKLIMFAGYGGADVSTADNKMLEFLKANPGLKSRINSTIVFPSYKEDEIVQIVHKQAELMDYTLDNEADNLIKNYFAERIKDRTFGNGREARRLIETCQYFMAERIFRDYKGKSTKRQLKTIMPDDVKHAIDKLCNDEKAQNGVQGVFGFALNS